MSFIFSTFWSGAISLREHVCFNSFIKNNHQLEVYSYNPLANLPEGVLDKDASEIITRNEYEKYKSKYPKRWDIFSDKFRYQLLLKKGGWWVDADIVCLRSSIDIEDDQSFMSFQEDGVINNACIKFTKGDEIMKYCVDYIKKWEENNNYNYEKLGWGAFAPSLITEAAQKVNRIDEAFDFKFAYPWSYKESLDLIKPSKSERLKKLSKDSYFCHLWNEMLSREKIPKSFLGGRGSYWNDITNLYSGGNYSSRRLKVKIKSKKDHLIYLLYFFHKKILNYSKKKLYPIKKFISHK